MAEWNWTDAPHGHKRPPAGRTPGVPWGWPRRARRPRKLRPGTWVRQRTERGRWRRRFRMWCWCRRCDRVWCPAKPAAERRPPPSQCPSCLSRAWRSDYDELAFDGARLPLWALETLRPRAGETLQHHKGSGGGRRRAPAAPTAESAERPEGPSATGS